MLDPASLRRIEQVVFALCVSTIFSGRLLAQEPPSNTSLEAGSLTRIRTALTAHAAPSKFVPPEPTFRVIVWDRPHLFELSNRLDLRAEYPPPGGLYAYGQRQQLGNPWIGQPLFKVDLLAPVSRVQRAVTVAERAHMERAARDEAKYALVEMCLANVCQAADR